MSDSKLRLLPEPASLLHLVLGEFVSYPILYGDPAYLPGDMFPEPFIPGGVGS